MKKKEELKKRLIIIVPIAIIFAIILSIYSPRVAGPFLGTIIGIGVIAYFRFYK